MAEEATKPAKGAGTERIYIGGLHPPQLTVQDLLLRLEESLGSTIEVVPDPTKKLDNDAARHVHLNVRTKTEDDPLNARERVAKMFNNVTWKGCKLHVEEARPHFLERLQSEIQERENRKEEQTKLTTPEPTATCTRRHLKIRQRFGTQVFSVDTKPYAVDSYREMNSLLKKIERRKKHFEQKLTSEGKPTNEGNLRTQSKLNRAVHLRLSEDRTLEIEREHSEMNEVSAANDDSSTSSSSSSGASIASSSTASESDSSSQDGNILVGSTLKSAYVWSSSDHSDSDTDDDSVSSTDKEAVNGSEAPEGLRDLGPKQAKGNHENSSDEETSSSHSPASHAGKIPTKSRKLPSDFDEFESAIDTGNVLVHDSDDSVEEVESHDMAENTDEHLLLKDVESNLGILASLFPDMKKQQPRKMNAAASAEEGGSDPASVKSGWSAGGVMLRYDPRKDSMPVQKELGLINEDASDKAAITTPEDNASSNSSEEGKQTKRESSSDSEGKGGSDSIGGQSESDDNEQMPPEMNSVVEGNIYKQEKLEDVFREARSLATPAASLRHAEATEGTFSFGFDLGQDSKTESTSPSGNSGAFSFSFFQSQEDSTRKEHTPQELVKGSNDPSSTQTTSTDNMESSESPPPSTFRRRGMLFPEDALDRYQEDFYVMNDGLKILQDLERYRRDDDVKAHWNQERQTLTKDWKRKRKHAQQGRSKHQRLQKSPRHS